MASEWSERSNEVTGARLCGLTEKSLGWNAIISRKAAEAQSFGNQEIQIASMNLIFLCVFAPLRESLFTPRHLGLR